MAPPVADTAPSAQRQARRPLSRIVPAIPHRLSKSRNLPSARPITPEESSKGTVVQNDPEPQPAAEKMTKQQLPLPSTVDTPMTPDSRASTGDADKSEVDTAVLAASPAKSAEDHVEVNGHHSGWSQLEQHA
jgi:hypothetical protein